MFGNMMHSTYTLPKPDWNVSDMVSQDQREGQLWEEKGQNLAKKVVIGTILASIVLVAISGNLLVCIAVLTDHRLRQNSNFFLVSLAVADMLVSVMVMTFAIVNDVYGRWLFGAVYCRIWISSDVMCSTASILNLCVISMDRYMHIKDPLHYETWMTTRRMATFIGTVWFISAFISFFPIHMGWHEAQDSTSNRELCILELNPVYAIVSSAISFYIPCVIMLVLYVQLYVYAERQSRTIHRTSMQTAERLHLTTVSAKRCSAIADHKAAVTLGIIVGAFLTCWVPFFVVNIIASLCGSCITSVVFQVLSWLGYFNSCLNPAIYSMFDTEFRNAFYRILCSAKYTADRRNTTFSVYTGSSVPSNLRETFTGVSRHTSLMIAEEKCSQEALSVNKVAPL